jgi:hypothetical protein
MTIKEAAVYLGRTVWGIRELIWAVKCPLFKPDGNIIWILWTSIISLSRTRHGFNIERASWLIAWKSGRSMAGYLRYLLNEAIDSNSD